MGRPSAVSQARRNLRFPFAVPDAPGHTARLRQLSDAHRHGVRILIHESLSVLVYMKIESRNASRFVFRRRLEYSMSLNDCYFMQHTIPVFDTSIIQDMVIY